MSKSKYKPVKNHLIPQVQMGDGESIGISVENVGTKSVRQAMVGMSLNYHCELAEEGSWRESMCGPADMQFKSATNVEIHPGAIHPIWRISAIEAAPRKVEIAISFYGRDIPSDHWLVTISHTKKRGPKLKWCRSDERLEVKIAS